MTPYEERLCRTCEYGKKPEYYKPCGALYRDDCWLYEPIEEMTPKKAIIQLEYLKNSGFKTKEQFKALDLAIKLLDIELLTDTEQRIFLKAMRREREMCQKVDDEYSDDASNVSLVKICDSIERKVKKIWECQQ